MKISIITVTFNSAATVRETLESVAIQNYPNIEHIIIDGASKDNTLEIVKEFPHIAKIVSEPDKGIYDAMNKGILQATGDIIGILNSDDIFSATTILTDVVKVFLADNSIGAVYGNISFFKTENPEKIVRFWKTKPYYDNFFNDGEVPPHPALFVRKKVYDTIGIYYPHFKISSDYEFMFRMFKVHQYKNFFIDKVIVKMRMGGESTKSWKNIIIGNKEVLLAWKMNSIIPPLKFYYLRPLKKIRQLF